jgi:molecular chaperone GrpE
MQDRSFKMNEQETIIDNENQLVEEKNSKSDLEIELEEQKKISEERLNHLKYLQADFDNMLKQFEKEKINVIRLANESLMRELLPVLDDFESSIRLMQNDNSREGMEIIYKKFYGILSKFGLESIDAVGKKLDPMKHEALIKEKSEMEDNEVIEEIQKGYAFNSKVIRPSKVKISEKFKNENEKIIIEDIKEGEI